MKTFYHNMTTGLINETCTTDLLDNYNLGDTLYKTEAGNAILQLVTPEEIDELLKQKNEHRI